MITGAIGLIIAVGYTISYADTLNKFTDMKCIACADMPCTAGDDQVDVYPKWLMVIRFGLGMWIVCIFAAVFAMFSGFHWITALVTGILHGCVVGIPMLVQTIFMGVYRYQWYG